MSVAFPDKLYYKIGEVAGIAGVRSSVLRFWESEFEFLKPEKSPTGQRLYTKKDVDLILELKRLLYIEKFTLEGVRKRISPRGKSVVEDPVKPDLVGLLREIRNELQVMRGEL